MKQSIIKSTVITAGLVICTALQAQAAGGLRGADGDGYTGADLWGKQRSGSNSGTVYDGSSVKSDGMIHYNKKCVEGWTQGNSSKSDRYKGIWCCQGIQPEDGEIDRKLIDDYFRNAAPAC